MNTKPATLYFMCGKMVAGKSTFAKRLVEREAAVLLVQDEWLETLFPGEIVDIPGFVKFSTRLRNVLAPHVVSLLSNGVSVVMDFPGNTIAQRAWFRELFEAANAQHELHFIDAPDDLCKRQLKVRSQHLPVGSAWTTDAEFDAIAAYFQPPTAEEGYNVIRHHRI
jgi:predicted kinase